MSIILLVDRNKRLVTDRQSSNSCEYFHQELLCTLQIFTLSVINYSLVISFAPYVQYQIVLDIRRCVQHREISPY